MANYATLKAAIQQVVKTNGNNEITGALLQQTLFAMVNSLGGYYQFAGIATPSTNPGTPDQNVFYLASTAGTYSNFGSIVIAENEAAILKYNGTWSKDSSGFATSEKVNQLEAKVDGNKAVVDLSIFTVYGGCINDGFWAGVTAPNRFQHIFFPVTPGEKFTVQNNLSDNTAKFAYLKTKEENPVNGGTPDYCQGYTIEETLPALASVNITIPSDCAYLYVTTMSNFVDRTPVIRHNEESKFDELRDEISGEIGNARKANGLYLQNTGIDTTTGAYTDNPSYSATQRIIVSQGDVVTTENEIYRVAKYDGGTFKGMVTASGKTYTVPSSVTHIAIMFSTDNSFGNIYINGKSANGVFIKDTLAHYDSELTELAKENPIYYFGKMINSSTGNYVDNANCFTTLDIPVSENDVISCERSMYRVAEYNNGAFARLFVNESTTYTTPSGVDTIRIVFLTGIPKPLYLNGIRVNATIISNLKSEAVPSIVMEHIEDYNNPHRVTAAQLGIGPASTSTAGLLSPEDKAKIDAMQPTGINITGSGVTKNASAFGFLPTATGDENNTALQNAVTGGGTILVDLPGIYDLSGNIVIPSNTTIIFGANTYVRKVANSSNVVSKYIFINEGAQTRTYNENISIIGLTLYTNGKSGNGGIVIYGLRGHIAFFYVKNVLLKDITIVDSTQLYDFNIHVCTFDNVTIDNAQINSFKDGLHFGNGKNLTIRNCILATKDDPIALNAYDYVSGNPELGWIENIHISNIILDERADNNGRAIEMIGGGWSDWASGNEYQSQGDTVVYDGKVFRTAGDANGTTYVASVPPASTSYGQTVTGADGITWVLVQDGAIYDCGVKNLYVDGFVVRHGGNTLFNISYEKSASYCRSYYPGSVNYGILENLYFNGVEMTKKMDRILNVTAPVRNIKISNSVLNAAYLGYYQNYQGGTNPSTEASLLTLDGNSFPITLASMRLDTYDRDIKLKTYGSMPINTSFTLGKMARVTVVSTDI